MSLPRVGNGDSKRQSVTPGHLLDEGGDTDKKGPARQEDTASCIFLCHSGSTSSNDEAMGKIAPPSSVGEGGEVGVPRNLFLRLGVG